MWVHPVHRCSSFFLSFPSNIFRFISRACGALRPYHSSASNAPVIAPTFIFPSGTPPQYSATAQSRIFGSDHSNFFTSYKVLLTLLRGLRGSLSMGCQESSVLANPHHVTLKFHFPFLFVWSAILSTTYSLTIGVSSLAQVPSLLRAWAGLCLSHPGGPPSLSTA